MLAHADERPLPTQRIPLLLGGDRHRPNTRQIPQLGKVAMVFASLPLHAFFGVVLMGMQTVLGETFYRSLQLSWHTDLLGDQRLGGGIAWAAGEVRLGGDDRVADSVASQRSAHRQATGPGPPTATTMRRWRLTTPCSLSWRAATAARVSRRSCPASVGWSRSIRGRRPATWPTTFMTAQPAGPSSPPALPLPQRACD